jgi:type II secretory pathway pseudopilin PulG
MLSLERRARSNRTKSNRSGRPDAGFALFEAIIALALASIALSAIYRTVGDSARATNRVRTKQASVALARSHLDSLGSDGTIQNGTTSGTYENGIRWRLTVTPLSSRPDIGPTQKPHWVALECFDTAGVSLLKLETAKIAREAK